MVRIHPGSERAAQSAPLRRRKVADSPSAPAPDNVSAACYLDPAMWGRCAYLPLAGVFIAGARSERRRLRRGRLGAGRHRCRAPAAPAAPEAPRRSPSPSSSTRRLDLQGGELGHLEPRQRRREQQRQGPGDPGAADHPEPAQLPRISEPARPGPLNAEELPLGAPRRGQRPDEQAGRRRAGRRHILRGGGGGERPLQRADRRPELRPQGLREGRPVGSPPPAGPGPARRPPRPSRRPRHPPPSRPPRPRRRRHRWRPPPAAPAGRPAAARAAAGRAAAAPAARAASRPAL